MRLLSLLAAVLAIAAPAAIAQPAPDVVLRGVLTGADHETYKQLPFTVPAGVEAVTVEFDYTGRDERTTVDLGLYDPTRFRGWSGGNKRRFTVAESNATPSYLPGPLPSGTWRLLLGIPNIRKDARAEYTAKISFARAGQPDAGFAEKPLRAGPGWYRGDLHAHSGHSDGSCTSQSGQRVPCPLYKTVEAAAARKLDFIAVTEHNATSHHNAMRELQPLFDRLLLIPGREITTFRGHANIFGVTRFVDFQLGTPRAPTVRTIQDQVVAAGGLFSINHPSSPSGEACMGCGWTAPGTDYAKVHAIEVVNGGSVAAAKGAVETPLSGIAFWHARLNEGHRITAIASSDNHDATRPADQPSAIGRPLTVVHAAELSQAGILAGVRSGRVFIDVEGSADRTLAFTATVDDRTAQMGEVLSATKGKLVRYRVDVGGIPDAVVEIVDSESARQIDQRPDGVFELIARSDGRRRWVRANIRSADRRLLLIGNPIYLR